MKTDPDIFRWGLHQLYDSSVNTNLATMDQNCGKDCGAHYVGESGLRGVCGSVESVENDEVIARALQEELSKVAIAEASGSSYTKEEHLQESVLTQNWSDSSSTRKDISGSVSLNEELDNMESSKVYAKSADKLGCGEELLMELSDEFSALDGEVCKRLNQMTPVPHVPRINRDLPSVDEEISDHQRLLDRLKLYDLVDLKVQGDGNCQLLLQYPPCLCLQQWMKYLETFRALSDQFYWTPENHKFVRQQVVNQLKSHRENYEGYVPMSYDEYLKKMAKGGEWGDHVTLQAAADSYGVKIFILTSFKDTCYIEIIPSVERSKRVICLSFWAEVHYNSIYPEGEFPVSECRKKKRWWQFGL